jgi:hypothetical protein
MLRSWVLLLLLVPNSALSCVVVGDTAPVRVHHSFSINVSNELGPVGNLDLEVTEFDPYLYRQLTREVKWRTPRESEHI